MKKYAVGYINFFDNDLIVDIVNANSIKDAIAQHPSFSGTDDMLNWLETLPDALDEIKREIFDDDSAIDIVEII